MSEQLDANDWLMAGGVKSAKFATVGDYVVGHIMRPPTMMQIRDINSKKPKFWDDGKPQMQMVVILMTDERDPDDTEDDGQRALYVKGAMQRALADAVRAAKAPGLQVGGKLMVTYTGDGEKKPGMNPPKLYECRYRVPEQDVVPVPDPEPELPKRATESIPF